MAFPPFSLFPTPNRIRSLPPFSFLNTQPFLFGNRCGGCPTRTFFLLICGIPPAVPNPPPPPNDCPTYLVLPPPFEFPLLFFPGPPPGVKRIFPPSVNPFFRLWDPLPTEALWPNGLNWPPIALLGGGPHPFSVFGLVVRFKSTFVPGFSSASFCQNPHMFLGLVGAPNIVFFPPGGLRKVVRFPFSFERFEILGLPKLGGNHLPFLTHHSVFRPSPPKGGCQTGLIRAFIGWGRT